MKHRNDFYSLLMGKEGKGITAYTVIMLPLYFLLSADEKLWEQSL